MSYFIPIRDETEQCAGCSFLFIVETTTMKVSAISVKEKIPFFSPPEGYAMFIPSTNLQQCGPSKSIGMLVAYSKEAKLKTNSTAALDSAVGWKWNLGIIIQHGHKGMSSFISPCLYSPKKSWYAANEVIALEAGTFSFQFLVEPEMDVRGYMKMPISPPISVVRRNFLQKQMKSMKKNISWTSSVSLPELKRNPSKNCAIGGGIMQLLKHPNQTTYKQQFIEKGSLLVFLEGPRECLHSHQDTSGYWLPLSKYGSLQEYIIFPTSKYSKVAKDPACINEVCTDKCNLTLFNPLCYPSIVFLYRETNQHNKIKHVYQRVLKHDEKKTHFDFGKYVVLCQTVQHPNIIQVPEYAADLSTDCNGNRGFGNRKCSSNKGQNVYLGKKGTQATVGTPFMAHEDLHHHDMFQTSTGDVTYLPTFNSLSNVLVEQAGQVMYSCNPQLDSFLTFVTKKLSERIGEEYTHGHTNKRHCRITIFTMGTPSTRSSGHLNEVHLDQDWFQKTFQDTAQSVIKQWRLDYPSDKKLMKELDYLECLAYLCNGFATPTTCGYNEMKLNACPRPHSFQCHFPMPGLNSSLKLKHGVYTYFFGSSFVHGSAVPKFVFLDQPDDWLIFQNYYNMIAWGGSDDNWRRVVNNNPAPNLPIPQTRIQFLQWLAQANNPAAVVAAAAANIRGAQQIAAQMGVQLPP